MVSHLMLSIRNRCVCIPVKTKNYTHVNTIQEYLEYHTEQCMVFRTIQPNIAT